MAKLAVVLVAVSAIAALSCGPAGVTSGSAAPVRRTLAIVIAGTGTVHVDPLARDCTASCTASVSSNTSVTLTATASAGATFLGWSGDCSGTAPCTISMAGDRSVQAVFNSPAPPPPAPPPTAPPPPAPPPPAPPPPEPPPPQPPPPPPPPPVADECAGLTPASLPDPVAVDLAESPQVSCTATRGVGDDLDATFVLGALVGNGPPANAYSFFRVADGHAVRVGGAGFSAPDETLQLVFSQPSGFTVYAGFPAGGSDLTSWSHDGALLSRTILEPNPPASPADRAVIGIDPSGGTAVARTHSTPDGLVTTYQRFDKKGTPETDQIVIGKGEAFVAAVGVALSGHALVIDESGKARWVAREGTVLTGQFALNASTRMQFLADGSLAVGVGPDSISGAQVEDGATAAGPLPDWLQQRRLNALYVVRSGKAYASWGSGQCGSGLEVLTTSGRSCGCVAVPGLTTDASVARDGSLIVPQSRQGCRYDLYPKLLR